MISESVFAALPIQLRALTPVFAFSFAPRFSSTIGCLAVIFNGRRNMFTPVLQKILQKNFSIFKMLKDILEPSKNTGLIPVQIFPGLVRLTLQHLLAHKHTCDPDGCQEISFSIFTNSLAPLIFAASKMSSQTLLRLLNSFSGCLFNNERSAILIRALILRSTDLSGLTGTQADVLTELLHHDSSCSTGQNCVHQITSKHLVPSSDLIDYFPGQNGFMATGLFDPMIRFAVRHAKFDPTDYNFLIIQELIKRQDNELEEYSEDFDTLYWIIERMETFEQVKLYHLICEFPEELGHNDFKQVILHVICNCHVARRALRTHPKTDLNHFYFSILRAIHERHATWVVLKNRYDQDGNLFGDDTDEEQQQKSLVFIEDFPLADFLADLEAGKLNGDFWARIMESPELQGLFVMPAMP